MAPFTPNVQFVILVPGFYNMIWGSHPHPAAELPRSLHIRSEGAKFNRYLEKVEDESLVLIATTRWKQRCGRCPMMKASLLPGPWQKPTDLSGQEIQKSSKELYWTGTNFSGYRGLSKKDKNMWVGHTLTKERLTVKAPKKFPAFLFG